MVHMSFRVDPHIFVLVCLRAVEKIKCPKLHFRFESNLFDSIEKIIEIVVLFRRCCDLKSDKNGQRWV